MVLLEGGTIAGLSDFVSVISEVTSIITGSTLHRLKSEFDKERT